MLDILKIKDVINVVPLLAIYVVPGYIFLYVKTFMSSNKKNEDKNIILKSIIISYIIINAENAILSISVGIRLDISSSIFILITVCIAAISAYLMTLFSLSEYCNSLMKKSKINKSIKPDILTELSDLQYGVWLRVYIQSEKVIYQGKLRKYEKLSDDGQYQILLSNYQSYSYDDKEYENNYGDNTRWVLLNVKENYRIEVFYDSRSKKIID